MKETYSRQRQLMVLCLLTDTVWRNWWEALFLALWKSLKPQMSEFGVSELEWGTELPLSALWKSCPWHAPPLKHSYGKIIFTNLEPTDSNRWKQQCEGVCEAAVTEFQREFPWHTVLRTVHKHASLYEVLNLLSPKTFCRLEITLLESTSNLLRRAGAAQLRCLAVQIFLQYSREYGLQRSVRDH